VTNKHSFLERQSFNADLSLWDVSQVTFSLSGVFEWDVARSGHLPPRRIAFNAALSACDVGQVTNLGLAFNTDLGVSQVTV
jgi:hypothetical protein